MYTNRLIGALLMLALLVACTSVQPAAQPALPSLSEIRIVVPGSQRTFTAQDERFAAIAADFAAALPTISSQARTFYDPARFTAEIAPLPHLVFVFSDDTDFRGQGISWRAAALVVAAPDGETLLLARGANIDDWSVYLPGDPAPLTNLLRSLTTP